MDKDREPSDVGKEELRRRMEETRQSVSETVDEIRDELSQALDWRTYVRRNPGAFLIGGAALGVIIGRALRPSPDGGFQAAEPQVERAGMSGQESPLRRIGELVATGVATQMVPVISTLLKRAFGFGPPETEGKEGARPWVH